MPELAEVEFYRKQWQCGLRQKILAVELHPKARVFRGVNTDGLRTALTGAVMLGSEAHGKQLFFRFSGHAWLGLHLGMTGCLRVGAPASAPARHDHLVLRLRDFDLVFTDSRQFGRVRFHLGETPPAWRSDLPAPILSNQFTRAAMEQFLQRHGRQALKAVLLMQAGFPGVGNWMADEILWQAALHPRRRADQLNPGQIRQLYRRVRFVCREAMRSVGAGQGSIGGEFGDPPATWLFHRRWRKGGQCPRDGSALQRAEIGGRTTCWCEYCQK